MKIFLLNVEEAIINRKNKLHALTGNESPILKRNYAQVFNTLSIC